MKAATPLRTTLTSTFSPAEAIATARLALAFGPLAFVEREPATSPEQAPRGYPKAA